MAPGSSSPFGPRKISTLDMKDTDQREETPRRIKININLAVEARLQDF